MRLFEIEDISDLTEFLSQEYEKLSDTFGIKQVPEKHIHYIENLIKKSVKLFRKPIITKIKDEIRLQRAIDTMPHGWLWRQFNPKLWYKIQLSLKNCEQDTNVKPEPDKTQGRSIITPAIIQNSPLQEVSTINEDENFDF